MMKGSEIYPGLYDVGIFRCTFMVGFIKNKALVCSEDSCVSTNHCEILKSKVFATNPCPQRKFDILVLDLLSGLPAITNVPA